MTTQPNTRIDSPHCTGQILAANAYGQFHTTYCVGVDALKTPGSSPPLLDPPEPSIQAILESLFDRKGFLVTERLKEQIDQARERGRQDVAKKIEKNLPRLWGLWNGEKWARSSCGREHFVSSPVPLCDSDVFRVREFDPMTGKPKA